MPNHVTNFITVDNKMREISNKLHTEKEKDDTEEVYVDFNNIIPEPKELLGSSHPNKRKKDETEEEHHERMEVLTIKYGHTSWYEWRKHNWGTKWNAYNSSVDRDTFEFQTAWSHPFPFVESLSSTFPTVRFEVKYADEDIGSNIGSYIMENGDVLEDNTPHGYMKQTKFACDLLDVDIAMIVMAELEEELTYETEI